VGATTKPSTNTEKQAVDSTSSKVSGYTRDLAFHVSLSLFLVASCWQFFGSEPRSRTEFDLRIAALGIGYCLSLVLWFISSHWPTTIKVVGIIAGLLLAFTVARSLKKEFDSGFQVLNRASVKNGRVIHAGLGLSYSLPTQSRVNLQPLMLSRTSQASVNAKLPWRLGFGEMAILSRIEFAPGTSGPARGTSAIVFEVLRDRIRDLNSFIREVRVRELDLSREAHLQVVRHTFHRRLAGFDLVEFEYVEELAHRRGRQVYLQTGSYLLHFSFITHQDEDRWLFDEFLKSIRSE